MPEPAGDEREDEERAFAEGMAAAVRGEEAAPGCTANAAGRAYLRGYADGAKARAGAQADGA